MKTADITVAVVKLKGDAKRGEQLFTQQGCIACHTVKVTDPLSGPYLGNIVETYISYLRRKIDPYSSEPLIQTKRGFGYMLKAGKTA